MTRIPWTKDRLLEGWQKRLYSRYDSWAVVTGASSGIGREIGYRLAEAGLNLVLVGRQRTLLEQMSTELANRHSIQVRIVELNLALESSVKTLEATTRDLDVGLLIGAAGFGTSGSFLNAQLEPEIEMLNVNCRALLELSWYFGRRFAERGRGGIVLMSSIVGFQGTPFAAHYAATKSYVQALWRSLVCGTYTSGGGCSDCRSRPYRFKLCHSCWHEIGGCSKASRHCSTYPCCSGSSIYSAARILIETADILVDAATPVGAGSDYGRCDGWHDAAPTQNIRLRGG